MSSPKVKKFNCAFQSLAQLKHSLAASQFSYQTPEIPTLFLMLLTPIPLNCMDGYSCSGIQRGQMYTWSCSLTKGTWSKEPVINLLLAGHICSAEQLDASWFLGWYSQQHFCPTRCLQSTWRLVLLVLGVHNWACKLHGEVSCFVCAAQEQVHAFRLGQWAKRDSPVYVHACAVWLRKM